MLTFAPDLLIESRYRLLENLGEGATGQVWKAEECTLSRIVALKFVHMDSGARDLRKRFENEGKVLADLEDPNIVQFLRFSVWQEQPFIVLEYVPGRTLRAVLDEVNRLPYERALNIASQMLGAAMAAHAHGVVHRDFKPGNIMVSDADRIKVVDFGIAKTLQPEGTGTGATSSNAAVGSVKYMSPEQCTNGQVDYRADLYSIGCILYEMLAGETPFIADSSLAMMQHHLHTPPPPIPSVLGGTKTLSTPPALNRFIAKAMAKDAAARFQSAKEALSAIETLLENAHDDLATQREVGDNSLTGTKTRRIGIRRFAAISIAVIVVAASSYAFIRSQETRVPPTIPSSQSSSIRLSRILQARSDTFLNEYPVEKRIRYYNEWLEQYPQAPKIKRANAYSFLADDYVQAKQPWTKVAASIRNAAVLYREAIQSGLQDPGDLALAYLSAASAEEKLGNNAEVIRLLKKGLATSSELRTGGYSPEAQRILATAYGNQKKYDLADAAYEEALQAQALHRFPKLATAKTMLYKATNLYNAREFKKANLVLLQAKQLADSAKDPNERPQYWIQWLRDYGLTCHRTHNSTQAILLLRESRELARKAHLPDEEALATSIIAECQLTLGNRNDAMKEYQSLSKTPYLACAIMRDIVHGTVKASAPDQPMVSDIQKCLLGFAQRKDRQEFIVDLTNKDLSDLTVKQQHRFNALVKDFQKFVDKVNQ